MEIAISFGIVNLILWIITWYILAENQDIQDKYNELLIDEIYELRSSKEIKEFIKKINKIKRQNKWDKFC